MNNFIPKEWELVSFGDITTFHKQGYYTKESYSTKGIRLARITDLHGRNVLYGNMPYIEIDDNTYEQFKVEENDFLIARSGSIGRYGIAKNIPEKTVFASYLIKFQFDERKVDLDLVGYIFQYSLLNQLDIITQGSSNININAENIKTLQFYLPRESEQKKIAEILTSVDKVIDLTEIEIEKLKNLKKGMMQDLLTKGIGHTKFKNSPIGKIPESWKVSTFEDACDLITDYTAAGSFASLKENVTYYYERSFARLIRLTDLRTDLKNPDGVFVDESGYKFLQRSNLRENDIMIANVGEYTGFTCLMPKFDMPATIAPNMFLVRPTSDFHALFMCSYMNLQQFQSEVDKISASSATKLLNKTNFRKMLLPVAPITEQEKIANFIDSLNQNLTNKIEKLDRIKNLKKGLMQDLLTGKVRVKV